MAETTISLETTPTPKLSSDSSFGRGRPFSASTRSTASNGSGVTMSPGLVVDKSTIDSLFCCRPGAIGKALENCQASIVNSELDGAVQGSWLITEIDHWDMEKEKLVLLTSKSILIVQYDFILLKVKDFRRILLTSIKRVQIGDLVYPAYSIMPQRLHGGARIQCGSSAPSFSQLWNPFCSDVGYVTLCHHLLAYKSGENETATYNVNEFVESLTDALKSLHSTVVVDNGPILVESYASVASAVYNQSHIGFNMSRGGVSF